MQGGLPTELLSQLKISSFCGGFRPLSPTMLKSAADLKMSIKLSEARLGIPFMIIFNEL